MAQTRKDLRGRVLRKGESQRRSDERYVYTYTDPLGRRKYVYAQDLVTLREKEAQLMKDQMDGLDIYVAGKATVNFVFDRYMSLKNNLKPTTKSNYLYMYDRFVRDTFGKRNIAEIKYSDVVQFYNYLVEKQELQINTLETVHTLLHPTFQLAVRDDIIRKNPSDGVMVELKKNLGMKTGVRHALTIPQQRAFMEYIATHPIYYHWWPIFTVFLGTGCRIGEVLGLRWEDINYEKRIICVNHNLTYYSVGEDRASENHISTPKTEAGMRTIPMLDAVKDAFEMIWEEQKEKGWTDAEIDGMTGFIFCNRYGNIMNAQSVNRAIKRISSSYNATEEVEARKEHREPVLLPNFSAHNLRHTFCTRLCERETNLKVIQSWSYVKKKYKLNVTNFLCSERSLTCYFYCILLDVFKILFLIFIWRQISTMTVNAHGIVKCFDVFKNQFMCMCIIKDFKPVDPFSLQKCMERFYTGVIPWICFL